MSNYGGSLFLYDKKFHFLSYKKNAPLRMRTRAKSRVLPDGNRARRTLFYFGMRWETCGRYFDARGDFCLQSIWAHKTRGSLDVACKPG